MKSNNSFAFPKTLKKVTNWYYTASNGSTKLPSSANDSNTHSDKGPSETEITNTSEAEMSIISTPSGVEIIQSRRHSKHKPTSSREAPKAHEFPPEVMAQLNN